MIADQAAIIEQNGQHALSSDDIHLYWDGLPFDADRVCHRIHSCGTAILENMVQVGKDLIWAKRVMGHGDFLGWIERDVGMHRRRASEFMRVAERIVNAQTPHAKAFLGQASSNSKHKLLSLLEVTDEEIKEAMQEDAFLGRPLDEIETMSVRELRSELTKERKSKQQALDMYRDAEKRNTRLEKKLEKGDPTNPVSLTEMPHAALLQAIEALSRAEGIICEWTEDPEQSDEWLGDGGAAADRTTAGLLTSLFQKTMNIRSLLTPNDFDH
ncbi:MAG: DUF3102 domain-containing protein [Gemmatimonadota bacterium]|nr:DUF3102 domain-containing protein [Gemmatimonadota bacterium]